MQDYDSKDYNVTKCECDDCLLSSKIDEIALLHTLLAEQAKRADAEMVARMGAAAGRDKAQDERDMEMCRRLEIEARNAVLSQQRDEALAERDALRAQVERYNEMAGKDADELAAPGRGIERLQRLLTEARKRAAALQEECAKAIQMVGERGAELSALRASEARMRKVLEKQPCACVTTCNPGSMSAAALESGR
jgi:chromosome segregation ATPase